ncbi:MAG: hypothetical protein GY801_17900 [bacterium]|nr:hypothetical protein [bacterium]
MTSIHAPNAHTARMVESENGDLLLHRRLDKDDRQMYIMIVAERREEEALLKGEETYVQT